MENKFFFNGTFFFEGTHLQIFDILLFIYYFAFEICSFKFIKRELGWCEKTFVGEKKFIREVRALKLFEIQI